MKRHILEHVMEPNTLMVDGYTATLTQNPETGEWRGEFIGLNGGAEFYAASRSELAREAAISLKVFMEFCESHGIEPRKAPAASAPTSTAQPS